MLSVAILAIHATWTSHRKQHEAADVQYKHMIEKLVGKGAAAKVSGGEPGLELLQCAVREFMARSVMSLLVSAQLWARLGYEFYPFRFHPFMGLKFSVDEIGYPKKSSGHYEVSKSVLLTLYSV